MNNILIWIGIVALSLQDYFKKPIKPTRQQQFLETGGTAQVFIAGTKLEHRKQLQRYFGKPTSKSKGTAFNGFIYTTYQWNFKFCIIEYDQYKSQMLRDEIILSTDEGDMIISILLYKGDSETDTYIDIGKIVKRMFNYITNIRPKLPNEYFMINDIAAAGDWELALQIAKSQDLL